MELRPSDEQRAVTLPEGSEPWYPTPEWAKTPPEDPVRERIEMAAEDLNRSIQEYGRATPDGRIESDEARRRRRQIARLVRRIGGWLSGCWPANDEDERQGCSRCEYRCHDLHPEEEQAGIAGCEGVEEAMVPLMMLEELRELLKLVREDVAK